MDQVENYDSEPEVVTPSADTEQETNNEVAKQETPTQEDSEWIKNLRKDRKEALRRADEAEQRSRMQEELLQRIMAQQNGTNHSGGSVQEEDFIQEISRDEYVAGEKVAKALKRQEEKFLKQLEEVKNTYASQKQNSLFNELKREFPDLDEVVNPETLALLEETNPRLASSIAKSNDAYSIAIQSYEYIKAKGLHEKFKPSKRASETDRKIEQNKKTVQSPHAFDKRPMASAFAMSDQQKKELAAEMYRCASQVGMGY